MPWADGTACGDGKWCYRGECVPRKRLKPVNGEWGKWEAYGECSRTCGGGIKRKKRQCNSPPPQHNGNYCVGERFKYKSCNTKECPPGSIDFRELQCLQFSNRSKTWYPKYNQIAPEDQCKLTCQVDINTARVLRSKAIDGTPCGPDTFDICVNGRCKPAGCDHVLYSTAKPDICGVCKGDNSTCQWITGSYNTTLPYGYSRLAKIPAGSRNIDIKQHSWMNMSDDGNYLALRLGENGEYIINGNNSLMIERMIIKPGVTIEYSGPGSVVERLNTSKRIDTDLILEVLSIRSSPPQVTYKYTVPRKILDRFAWTLSDWSNCSLTCQGMKHRRAECRSIEHKDVVPDDYCRELEKPREESQMCNSHCTLEWYITVSECSNHCGFGTRNVTSRCTQRLLLWNYLSQTIPPQSCAHLPRPNDTETCIGPCEDAHWSYGKWGTCSVTCGGGIQHRTAKCVDSNHRPVSDENCMGQRKELEQQCGQNPCPEWAFKEWNPCSVTCGIGMRSAKYVCHIENRVVNNSSCREPAPEYVDVCNPGTCDQWHHGDWSSCSATCGEGIKQRKVTCKGTNGMISNKCSSSEKPEDITVCVLKPCPIILTPIKDPPYEIPSVQGNEVHDIIFRAGYKWHVHLQECSRPCIEVYMHATVKCVSIETGTTADDSYCDNEKKPHTKRRCDRSRCPIWRTSDWGPCNTECGIGHQFRQIRCENSYGDPLLDEKCLDDEKPAIVQECRKRPCANSQTDRKYRLETNILRKWRISPWTPCSKSCGTGLQRRRVECTMRRGNHGPEVAVKDEQCSRLGLRKPKSQRTCRRLACNYVWQEGPWSECSAECGEGIQQRIVSCNRVNRWGVTDLAPIDNCPMSEKPQTQRPCILRECDDEYYWTTTNWGKCSHPCGQKGRQIRRLFCKNRKGDKVARYNCPKRFKPPRKQVCNQRKCYATTCLEAKKHFGASKDTEYRLLVAGRTMSIYCHRMATNEPREYLTLPAGPQENYAEIYDKTLDNPYICPYNGPRNENCICNTSGKTNFRRVRIDPVELYIIENDYTFSRMTGSNRVEYGMAGDCNSIARCPQGRFSINLSGTLFKLSSSVSWTSTRGSSSEINVINNQHITGKCGGYCGYCKPKNGLKLDILPP